MAVSGTAETALPNDATAPSRARQFVHDHGAGLSSDTVDDAELLVSELVTNALQHGQPFINLQLRAEPPCLGVAVQDDGAAVGITPHAPGPEQPRGRGLFIVDAVASAWGVTATVPPPGKTVWFELVDG